MPLSDYENNFTFTEQDREDYRSGKLHELARQQMYGHLDAPTDVEPERTFGGTLQNIAVGLGKGSMQAGAGLVGLADLVTPGNLGKGLENIGVDFSDWAEDIGEYYTPAQKAAIKRRQQKLSEADTFLGKVGAIVSEPSTIAQDVVEAVPSMVTGGYIGRGLGAAARGLGATSKALPLVTGAAGEGAITAGQIQEDIRRQSGGETTLGQQAKAIGAGAVTSLIGLGGAAFGKALANKLGVKISDIDTLAAGGKIESAGNIVKRIIAGGISEGVFEELPQSMQEQIWTNAALGNDLLEGVSESGAAGLLSGAAMGGGINIMRGQQTEAEADTRPPREQLIDVDRKIMDLESAEQTEENQKSLSELYQQRDNLLRQIRGIDSTTEETIPQTGIDLPTDLNIIEEQINNLEQSGATNLGSKELLDELYTKRDSIIAQQEDDYWKQEEKILNIQNEIKSIDQELKPLQEQQRVIKKQFTSNDEINNRLNELNKKAEDKKRKLTKKEKAERKKLNSYLNNQNKIVSLNNRLAELKTDRDLVLEQQVKRQDSMRFDERQQQQRLDQMDKTPEPRSVDMITRAGKPYQRRNYLENYINSLSNNKDYDIVRVHGGWIGQLNQRGLARRQGQIYNEDENGFWTSQDQYWEDVKDKLWRQKAAPYQKPYDKPIGPVPLEQQVRQKRQDEWNQATEEAPIEEVSNDVVVFNQPEPSPVGTQVEQTGEEVGEAETVVPAKETQTIEEDSLIRDYNNLNKEINDLNNQLEKVETELSFDNDPETQRSLQDQATEITYQLDEAQKNLDKVIEEEQLSSKLLKTKSRFQTSETQKQAQPLTFADIKKMYKGQDVFQSDDGTISISFDNGQGATIQSIQDAGNGFIQMAIDTGQMSKNGKILGITTGNNILLDSEFANKKTVWHENKHLLDNLGMIRQSDNSALNKEFNKLRKTNKLDFAISTHENPMIAMEENRANMFAQVMVNRTKYANTPLGKMIQRVMDFFNGLYLHAKRALTGSDYQNIRNLAREVETGKIYNRETRQNQTTKPMFQEAGNTNSQEFKNWFKDSKVVDENGDPLVVYHSTANDFNEFKTLPGSDIGFHFGSQNQAQTRLEDKAKLNAIYAGRGFDIQDKDFLNSRVMPVYLSISNPLTLPDSGMWDAGSIAFEIQKNNPEIDLRLTKDQKEKIKEIGTSQKINKDVMLIDYIKSLGYDGIQYQNENEGAGLSYMAFEPTQIKSAFNRGTFDPNNPDIRFQSANWDQKYPNINFETREALNIPEQIIPESEYEQNRKEHRDLVAKTKQALASLGRKTNRTLNKYLGVASTNLLKIHPMLQAKTKRLDFDTIKRIQRNLATAEPVLRAMGKMSKNDRADFSWAVKNGDKGKIFSLANTYGFTNEYRALQEMLDQIHQDLKDVGYKLGYIENYWPRMIKDREGFLIATKEISQDPIFTQALEAKANKLGKTVEELSPNMRAQIISEKIAEIKAGVGGSGNLYKRVYNKIPIDLGKYYAGASASLVNYIYSTSKNIEARRFFGKMPTKIRNAREIVFIQTNEIAELKKQKELLVAQNQDTTQIDEMIKSKQDTIDMHQKKIEEYGHADNFEQDISSYIAELMANGLIDPSQEKTLQEILNARMHERGVTGTANVFKNLSLIDTMGSPLSAITQIQELGFTVYVGGLTPRGITNSVRNIGKALAKRSDITKEDLGLEWISQEFADPDTMSRAVNKVFKLTGLDRADSIGKEALINNSYDNYRVKAQNKEKLFKEIRHMFNSDKETNEVINDLRNDNKDSENVQFLVFSRLLDFHPATKSEMAEKALSLGNWRLAYLLKSFAIKQMDVFRRDVWHKLKEGHQTNDKGLILEGMRNMGMLLGLLSLAGAGADELKDVILGKEMKFEDHIIEQLLSLGGANRYLRIQIRKEGTGTALGKQILPPFKFIDAITKDAASNTWELDTGRWVDSIPYGGKIYYWRMGRGRQFKQSIEEQDFAKDSKKFNQFNKDFENSTDKRLFLKTNFETLKQKKLYDNYNKALRGNKRTINKLKDIEQTPNVKRRLQQLEQQRKILINKYFEIKNNL